MAFIDILSPVSGSTVGTTFTASGTFSPNNLVPQIQVNQAGGTLSTVQIPTPGHWTMTCTGATAPQTGVSVTAGLTGATGAIETNITIQADRPPVVIDDSMNFRAAKEKGRTTATIHGTYSTADVDAILVTAYDYLEEPRNHIDPNAPHSGVLASVGADLNPDKASWTCTLTFTPSTAVGNRVVIRALAMNRKGRIVGQTARRHPKA